ncbi:unnamed protein product [Ceratitis capitata]|uniref:(Mediterranean fruit fly) hypothetical protein n=1 Tax=Ceratitis capitata TaxID=7213 RepID=W8BB67_CERCA|nr:unnamed protein product [Ceratitis capitata]
MHAVGNIRLSNSAESIQYPATTTARRPTTRRLIGVNVPRQYPLRSSLRRNREKQVGSSSGNTINGSGNSITDSNGILTASAIVGGAAGGAGRLPVATAPPSVRNSIAECCSSNNTPIGGGVHESQHIVVPTFQFNRLEGSCGDSRECKRQFLADLQSGGDACAATAESGRGTCVDDLGAGSMPMDTTEPMKVVCDNVAATYADVSGNNNLIFLTTGGMMNNMPTLMTPRNLENVVSATTTAMKNQSNEGLQTADEGVSTITFKAPRV